MVIAMWNVRSAAKPCRQLEFAQIKVMNLSLTTVSSNGKIITVVTC